MGGTIVPQPDGGLAIRVDLSVYGVESVLRAAHRFTGRCHVHVEKETDSVAIVRVHPKTQGEDASFVAGELLNEILDQDLRSRLAASTEPIRRLILAQAFSSMNLLHPELDDADPSVDPAGIAAPDDPHP